MTAYIPRIHCSGIVFPRVSYKCCSCRQTDPRRYCEARPTWPWWKTWLVAGMRIRSASRGRGSRKHPGRP